MESALAGPASASASPRVFLPVTQAGSGVPTYAVLQLLGFSTPNSNPIPFPNPNPNSNHNPNTSPNSSYPKSKYISNTNPSSSDTSSGSTSDEKPEKKLTSIKPTRMKKSGIPSAVALSPRPTISITHTERDTIIHTDSQNFRQVVHQLTGAGSGDGKDCVLPTTRTGTATAIPSATTTTTIRIIRPGAKLLERRKSSKTLDRLTTSCRDMPALVPSPVTPLASDFEKICGLPATPPSSISGGSASAPGSAAPLGTAISISIAEPSPASSIPSPDLSNSSSGVVDMDSSNPVNTEDAGASAANSSGFFIQATPRLRDPTLLNLFPESPHDQ